MSTPAQFWNHAKQISSVTYPAQYHARQNSTHPIFPTSHLHPGPQSSLFLSGFTTKTPDAFLFLPIRVTWPIYLFFDLITLIIFMYEHKS